MKSQRFISEYGAFSTIVVAIIGIGVFGYPRIITENVGNNGWIVTFIFGLIEYIFFILAYKVIEKNEFQDIYTISFKNLGRFLGSILLIILLVNQLIGMSLGMRSFTEVLKMYLLEKTPTEFLVVVTILTGTYLVRAGLDALIKFNEISFFIMFIPTIIILLFALNIVDITNLLPITLNKPSEYLNSFKSMSLAFSGLEIIYLIVPLMTFGNLGKKAIKKSTIFITIFYVFIVIFCLAVFTASETKTLIWPTVTLIRSIDIRGSFVERWDGIVMTLWILFYFTSFVNGYYFCADIFKNVFNLKDVKISSLFVIPAVYLISMYPQNITEVAKSFETITPILTVLAYLAFPLVLIIISSFRKRRRRT